MIKNFWKINLFAETYSNSYSWGHRAILEFWWYRISSKIRYYNRTWECWTYQTVLQDVFEKFLDELSRWQLEQNKEDIENCRKFLYDNHY